MKRLAAVTLGLIIFATPSFANDWRQIAYRLMRSTVQLQTYAGEGYCSGFVIDNKRDFVMTDEHCVSSAWAIRGGIVVDNIPAVVKWSDVELDTAVLYVEGVNRPELRPNLGTVRVGQDAAAYGFGYGLAPGNFRSGQIGALEKFLPSLTGKWMEFNFTTIGGMSGGPIVDDDSKVIATVQRGNGDITIGRSIKEIWKATKDYWKK